MACGKAIPSGGRSDTILSIMESVPLLSRCYRNPVIPNGTYVFARSQPRVNVVSNTYRRFSQTRGCSPNLGPLPRVGVPPGD